MRHLITRFAALIAALLLLGGLVASCDVVPPFYLDKEEISASGERQTLIITANRNIWKAEIWTSYVPGGESAVVEETKDYYKESISWLSCEVFREDPTQLVITLEENTTGKTRVMSHIIVTSDDLIATSLISITQASL